MEPLPAREAVTKAEGIASQALLRRLLGSWVLAVWETDSEGVVVTDSPSWRACTGQTRSEWLGYGWLDAIHPDDRGFAERQWRKAIAARRVVNAEFRLRTPDGGYRWTNVRAEPVLDEGGCIEKWVGVNIDIDARKQDESAQRDVEERRAFLLKLSDAVRPLANPIEIQNIAARLLGEHLRVDRCAYGEIDDAAEFVTVHRDYHVEDVGPVAGSYRLEDYGLITAETIRRGDVFQLDDVLGCPMLSDDKVLQVFAEMKVSAAVVVPLIKGGRLVALITLQQSRPRAWTKPEIQIIEEVADRTWSAVERTRAEAAQRESEERLRLAVDNADVGFWDVDMVKDKLIWPARTKGMFGISPDVPVTMEDFYNGLHPHDRATISAAFKAAADPERRELYDVEYRAVGKEDGILRWVAAKGRGVFDDHGRCLRVAGTAVEITARKRAEEALKELNATLEARIKQAIEEREEAHSALRQSQKMEAMGQLTGGVAHDFNNLLTPIFGALDMLQRQGLGGEREQRLVTGAMQSAERAKTLVQRLLAFARRQPLQRVSVNIAQLVKTMGELIESTVGPRIHVVVEADEHLRPARADPNQLEMALLNLAVNARDAMPTGGTLRIAAREEEVTSPMALGIAPGPYVRLSVADTGQGMDEHTLVHAVEPFFSTKGVGKGTGLGLSMVHGLAKQLEGTLKITSQPGVGTNVELWLPLGQDEPVSAKLDKAVNRHPGIGAGRVLLVDDEELARLSTADMLAGMGYDVVEAQGGEEALKIFADDGGFDLIVTDHLMPGLSGTDVARAVRSNNPAVPILLISGYAETEGIDADIQRLIKPFRRSDLETSVAKVVAQRGFDTASRTAIRSSDPPDDPDKG